MHIWYSFNQKLVKLIKYSSIAIIIQYNPVYSTTVLNLIDHFFLSSEHKITFYEYQVIPDNRGLSLVKIEREAAKWPRSRDMLEAEKNDPNDWTELDKNDHTSIQKLTARDSVVTFVWRFDINLLLI